MQTTGDLGNIPAKMAQYRPAYRSVILDTDGNYYFKEEFPMQTTGDLGNIPAKMAQYRQQLLAFGMLEPTQNIYSEERMLFYKPAQELTAFVVNLTAKDDCIVLMYGYASTAFTRFAGSEQELTKHGVSDIDITIREKAVISQQSQEAAVRASIYASTAFTRFAGSEQELTKHGVSDIDITIREKAVISQQSQEAAVRASIADMYHRYQQTEKAALLACAKEKRKAFLNQISLLLKPLGFRKKGNSWTHPLTADFYLMFNAQKSIFSDEYYFNVYIGKNGTNCYGDCYYTRIFPQGPYPADWQGLSQAQWDAFFTGTMVPTLDHILRTPLEELGADPVYQRHCYCNRTLCSTCWMGTTNKD